MKKLVKCEEVEGEGLLLLLGEKVLVWCMKVTKYRFGDLLKKLNADIPSDFGDDYDDDLTSADRLMFG